MELSDKENAFISCAIALYVEYLAGAVGIGIKEEESVELIKKLNDIEILNPMSGEEIVKLLAKFPPPTRAIRITPNVRILPS